MGCPSSSPPSPPRVCGVPSLLDSWFVWESWVRVSNAGSPHGHDHAAYRTMTATYISRPIALLLPGPRMRGWERSAGPPTTTVLLGRLRLRHDLRFGLRDGFCRELPTACRASYCIVDAAWVARRRLLQWQRVASVGTSSI